MTDGDVVLTRDESSGKIHKRVRNGKRLMVDERDNLDAAGTYRIIGQSEVEDADPSSLCEWCFAPTVVTINAPTVTRA